MKANIKFTTLLLFFCSAILSGQFNTITPLPTKKSGTTNYFEKQKIAEKKDSTNEKEKTSRKPKKISNKSELKLELDSLKKLLVDNIKLNAENKVNYKKIEDSIISLMRINKIDEKPVNEFKNFELINEERTFSKIYMPLNRKINITSGFGHRKHPISGKFKMHSGIDLQAYYEDVHSVLDGYVVAAGWDSKGGGNYIKIKHPGGFETSYAHLSHIYYQVGEMIKGGFIIGKSGNSGNSTGPHLHFTVKENGNIINPLHFLNDLIKVNNLIALRHGK